MRQAQAEGFNLARMENRKNAYAFGYALNEAALQQAFEQQAELAELADVIDAFLLGNVHRQGPVVLELLKLRDQSAVLDFALTDADLQGFLVRVAEVQVIDVLHQLVDAASLIGAVDVMAGIERQAESFHVVAEDRDRVGVFRKTADLTLEADA